MTTLLHNHCWVCWWKNFENWPIFGKVMGNSRVCFFTHGVYHKPCPHCWPKLQDSNGVNARCTASLFPIVFWHWSVWVSKSQDTIKITFKVNPKGHWHRKFHPNPSTTFWVILLAHDHHTHKWTNWFHDFLGCSENSINWNRSTRNANLCQGHSHVYHMTCNLHVQLPGITWRLSILCVL